VAPIKETMRDADPSRASAPKDSSD
jgi:hypothetical protein